MVTYNLTGGFVLSTSVDKKNEKELTEQIKDLENELLKRGVLDSDKGAEVKEISFEKGKIKLKIKSTTSYVRADDALLRIKNFLSEKLGKLKVGIRDIFIDEYTIEFESPKPKEEFDFPFVKKWVHSKDNVHLEINTAEIDEEFLRKGSVSRIISTFKERVDSYNYKGKEEGKKVLWTSKEKSYASTKDPTEEMVKKGWVRQGPGEGQWHFDVKLTWIMNAMRKLAVSEIMEPMGFQEIISPKVVPFSVWEKTGHLAGTEPEMYFVSLPKSRDVNDWKEVIDTYKITKKAPVDKIKEMIKDPIGGNCYAQCPNIYWAYSKKIVSSDSLPVKIFDMSGPSNRNESGGRHGIERVNEFHRLEPVFIGTPQQVEEIKEEFLKRYVHVFNDILEIEWRYADVVPFYMQQAGSSLFDKEEKGLWKGTIDFEAYLPYKGRNSEWLEFQNLSIVGDKYTKAFSIKAQKGELWSGCSGIGFERWAAVFLSQHGLDPDKWPKNFKKYLGKEPTEINFV